jgi:hypothetical protein
MATGADKVRGGHGNRWRILGWGAAVALLVLPFVAKAPWTLSDYVFAGAVLAIVGGLFEVAVRTSRNLAYRGGIALALATSLLLVWINGAVGIIGNEGNPANLMFLVVILVAIAGAIVARGRAEGMARAMAVAAGAQALVLAIVAVRGLGATEPPGLPGVLALIGVFALMWLGSAGLFRLAARQQA